MGQSSRGLGGANRRVSSAAACWHSSQSHSSSSSSSRVKLASLLSQGMQLSNMT